MSIFGLVMCVVCVLFWFINSSVSNQHQQQHRRGQSLKNNNNIFIIIINTMSSFIYQSCNVSNNLVLDIQTTNFIMNFAYINVIIVVHVKKKILFNVISTITTLIVSTTSTTTTSTKQKCKCLCCST